MSNKLRLSMQYFAESAPAESPTEPSPPELVQQSESTPPQITADDIKTMISDKIGDVTKIVDNKLTEAQKLAKMSSDEKAHYEQERRAADLARREQELTRRELMATARDTLMQKGVPVSLSTLLNYSDADSCTKSIELLETEYKAAVAAGINEAMKGTTPKVGGNPSSATSLRAAMGLPPA